MDILQSKEIKMEKKLNKKILIYILHKKSNLFPEEYMETKQNCEQH